MSSEGASKGSPQKKKPSTARSSLCRSDGNKKGMDPRSILTGFYGSRGERLRHVVHDGALRMPKESLDITKMLESSKTTYELPSLDAVKQPTKGTKGKITVTDVEGKWFQPAAVEGSLERPPLVFRTVMKNRVIDLSNQKGDDSNGDAQRIRGGGGDLNPNGDQSNQTTIPNGSQASIPDPTTLVANPLSGVTANSASVNTQHTAKVTQNSHAPMANTSPHLTTATTPQPATATPLPTRQPAATVTTGAPAPLGPTPSNQTTIARTQPAVQPSQPSSLPVQTIRAAQPPSHIQRPVVQAPQTQQAAPVQAQLVRPQVQHPSHIKPAVQAAPQATHAASTVSTSSQPVQSMSSAPAVSVRPPQTQNTSANVPVGTLSNASAPALVTSTTTTGSAAASNPDTSRPQVVSLKKRPASQWEQHIPGPHDEMQPDPQSRTPKPAWYDSNQISDLERTMLPEWFNESAPHRTPESYKEAREKIIQISEKLGNRYVTSSLVRRSIPGDAGSLHRLQSFLVHWNFINEEAINDSAPTPLCLREETRKWNPQLQNDLMLSVVEQSKKRPKLDASGESASFAPIDWDAVAEKVGHGVSNVECEREFLAMPLNGSVATSLPPAGGADDPSTKPRAKSRQESFRELIEEANPTVIESVTSAALQATENLEEAQSAGIVGLVGSRAMEEARYHESQVSRLLAELVDQRMQKLENRMALMDDLEGILEAERVALELERRDLYTARCRHWFGGS